MSNVIDYMEWRGDVPFSGSPFNEIDNIILAMSSFVDLSGIVSSDFSAPAVRFDRAMKYFDKLPDEKKYLGALIPRTILDISKIAARCKRYAGIRLCGYVNDVDEARQMQFAALTLLLPDRSAYVAYRGTDDTIVGWKEDFRLSFMTPVPAQLRAAQYLKDAAERCRGAIRIGGHSKGGNLAMWAASHVDADIQRRIIKVYNNDGPGFLPEVLETPSYSAVADRIITYIPQSSVVGALLERGKIFKIVKSDETAILQHDPLSWEVLGPEFVCLEKRSKFGEQSESAMRKWVYSMSPSERERFTDLIFGVIDATGAKTLTDLNASKVKNLGIIMKAIRELDRDSRSMMSRAMRGLFGLEHGSERRLPANDDDDKPQTADGARSSAASEDENKDDDSQPIITAEGGELRLKFLIPVDERRSSKKSPDSSRESRDDSANKTRPPEREKNAKPAAEK